MRWPGSHPSFENDPWEIKLIWSGFVVFAGLVLLFGILAILAGIGMGVYEVLT